MKLSFLGLDSLGAFKQVTVHTAELPINFKFVACSSLQSHFDYFSCKTVLLVYLVNNASGVTLCNVEVRQQ